MDKSCVDEIVLVGGSTRIPKIQCLLQEFFNGKKLCRSINPDEAVAYGAAILAALNNGDENARVQNLVLMDITPLSLGINVASGEMSVVPKSTPIPTVMERNFTTGKDNQDSVSVGVYEGERAMVKDNNLLGKFKLSGITPAPRGHAKLVVRFDINTNGILTVTVEDMSSGKKAGVTIDKESMSKEEIVQMILEAEKMKIEDEAYKKKVAAWNFLENYAYKIKRMIDDKRVASKLDLIKKTEIEDGINQVITWLDDNKPASCSDYGNKTRELEAICRPIYYSL